jgi:hypothetical protein
MISEEFETWVDYSCKVLWWKGRGEKVPRWIEAWLLSMEQTKQYTSLKEGLQLRGKV